MICCYLPYSTYTRTVAASFFPHAHAHPFYTIIMQIEWHNRPSCRRRRASETSFRHIFLCCCSLRALLHTASAAHAMRQTDVCALCARARPMPIDGPLTIFLLAMRGSGSIEYENMPGRHMAFKQQGWHRNFPKFMD